MEIEDSVFVPGPQFYVPGGCRLRRPAAAFIHAQHAGPDSIPIYNHPTRSWTALLHPERAEWFTSEYVTAVFRFLHERCTETLRQLEVMKDR